MDSVRFLVVLFRSRPVTGVLRWVFPPAALFLRLLPHTAAQTAERNRRNAQERGDDLAADLIGHTGIVLKKPLVALQRCPFQQGIARFQVYLARKLLLMCDKEVVEV